MKKTLLNITAMGCALGLMWGASPSQATPGLLFAGVETPTSSVDLGRAIEGIILGIINLSGDGESKALLIAKQEEINEKADGTYNSSPNNASSVYGQAAGTAFTNGAYAYVNANVWNKDLYVYDKLAKALGNNPTLAQTRQAVIDTFYADGINDADKRETTYKETIRQQRQDYARLVTKHHLDLSYNLQQAIQGDLTAAGKAPVASDNEVGAIAIDAQTLDEMIKTTLVDLTIQIEMMEADALAFMVHQPVEMLAETKGE